LIIKDIMRFTVIFHHYNGEYVKKVAKSINGNVYDQGDIMRETI